MIATGCKWRADACRGLCPDVKKEKGSTGRPGRNATALVGLCTFFLIIKKGFVKNQIITVYFVCRRGIFSLLQN